MIDAPTLDEITGHTVMTKMRELIKQMTQFAQEVADLVNTIPTDVQDTYSREAVDAMIEDIDSAIDNLSDNVYTKSEVYDKTEVYNKTEVDNVLDTKQDTLIAGTNITIQDNVISATGSASGGVTKIAYGTFASADDTISVNQATAGTYIINLPNFGGTYIAQVISSSYAIESTEQIETVTPSGGSQAVHLMKFKGSISTNTLNFRMWAKDMSSLSTKTWSNILIPINTYYEIYFISITE